MMDGRYWALSVGVMVALWFLFMWIIGKVSGSGTWHMPAYVQPPDDEARRTLAWSAMGSGYSPGDNPANRAAPMPPPPSPAQSNKAWLDHINGLLAPADEIPMFGDDFEGWMKQDLNKQRRMLRRLRPSGFIVTSGQKIEVTTMEDIRPRFVKAGKVINRYRPLKPRRIRLVHR